jgi:toxin FitB
MIILDTNVISEMVRRLPHTSVLQWLSGHIPEDFYTTSVTEAESFAGLACAPDGRKKRELSAALESVFERFEHRILSFDRPSARAYGLIVAERRRMGRPIKELDGQIAAIALSRDATVATRDVSDFEGCGLRLVNPWDAA